MRSIRFVFLILGLILAATIITDDGLNGLHAAFKALGWGIVPVANDLLPQESVQGLLGKLEEGIDSLVQGGIDEELVASSSWVLPSCDPVLLSPENADLAISMTGQISRTMKKKYGFE